MRAQRAIACRCNITSATLITITIRLRIDCNSAALRLRPLRHRSYVLMVAWRCNGHAQAIRHIRRLLSTELAQTLACSQILSRIDYCNAVLRGAPTGTAQKQQRVQNSAARIVLQASTRSDVQPLAPAAFYCQSSSGSVVTLLDAVLTAMSRLRFDGRSTAYKGH